MRQQQAIRHSVCCIPRILHLETTSLQWSRAQRELSTAALHAAVKLLRPYQALPQRMTDLPASESEQAVLHLLLRLCFAQGQRDPPFQLLPAYMPAAAELPGGRAALTVICMLAPKSSSTSHIQRDSEAGWRVVAETHLCRSRWPLQGWRHGRSSSRCRSVWQHRVSVGSRCLSKCTCAGWQLARTCMKGTTQGVFGETMSAPDSVTALHCLRSCETC